ncbi:MAG: amino acid adenylation domain-containing protein [Hydrococcus sp. CRU_1_1]|nr:amino acid adenylation domain-containing protein [Hydrococcus sp. CRU_1_1]
MRQAVVIAVGRQESKYLVAYVVAATESTSDRDLRKFLAQRLPEYMLPHQIIFLNSLPLTANGKSIAKLYPHQSKFCQKRYSFPLTLKQNKS